MTVTAAITTYKRDIEILERAINSVLNQTHKPDEIFVVDDNSAGSELSVYIKQLTDRMGVKYLYQGDNYGVYSARNFAIENATSEWIAFLDDDDEWLPGKLESQLHAAENHPSAKLIFGIGIEHEDNTGKERPSWQKTVFKESPTHIDELTHDHVGSASNPLIHVESVKKTGGFRKMPAVEDYDLWIRMAENYPLCGIDESVFIRHMDSNEHISTNHKNTFLGYEEIYKYNKTIYNENPNAKRWILYNIMREGIKGKQIRVVPYGLMWLWYRIRKKNK